ncbi:hypothetical protein WSM22_36270 [Cytophagales bacterium WSM2-2]|nr:hypothetical protein WSM22_36270 [Cytophagales bacterium WSM2-2]
MKKLLYIIAGTALITSCVKEIHLNLSNQSGQILIDGNVTDQAGPYYVTISRSVAFTESNQYPPVTDAVVVISDNSGQIETLQYDATAGSYKTDHLRGINGNTYTLSVTIDGTLYSAQSTLPQRVALDSLREVVQTIVKRTRYSIIPVFTDAPSLGNYYRFKAYIDGKLKDSYFNISDNTNNGLVNTRGLSIAVGSDVNEAELGDTITIEMQCIDNIVYTYFTALSQISNTNAFGRGVTPSNPPGNISNNALGIFSAHTVQSKSIILK